MFIHLNLFRVGEIIKNFMCYAVAISEFFFIKIGLMVLHNCLDDLKLLFSRPKF